MVVRSCISTALMSGIPDLRDSLYEFRRTGPEVPRETKTEPTTRVLTGTGRAFRVIECPIPDSNGSFMEHW